MIDNDSDDEIDEMGGVEGGESVEDDVNPVEDFNEIIEKIDC